MQKPDSRKSGILARRARVAARAFLAVILLLTLVGGSIPWRASASGPLCTMSCCAGKAPHAAGSCMHGACETGDSIDVDGDQHSQQHHEQPAPTSDSESADQHILSGVTAGVCATDMGNVPTIEATPDQATPDKSASVTKTENIDSAISPAVMSPPCEPGCGACTSGFATPNRFRNMAALARLKSALPQSSGKLADGSRPLTPAACVYSRLSAPRGPPRSFS